MRRLPLAVMGQEQSDLRRQTRRHDSGECDLVHADVMRYKTVPHDIKTVEAFEKDAPFGTSSSSNILTRGTANYTSSVFSGVPAGGVCWVKQDFRATVVNYTVISKYFLGNSYQTGICLFQWTPNYSWFKGNLNVHSKGTFHAIVKGSPISFSATFKAFFHTNKSSLYQEFQ